MKNIIESITYVITSLVALRLLMFFQPYWINASEALYLMAIGVLLILSLVFFYVMSSRDKEVIIKTIVIFGIPFIIACFIYTDLLVIIFVTMVSGVAGFSTYFNYYRMAEYMVSRTMNMKRKRSKISLDFEFNNGFVKIDEYLFENYDNLWEGLKCLKNSLEKGEAILVVENNEAYVKEVS